MNITESKKLSLYSTTVLCFFVYVLSISAAAWGSDVNQLHGNHFSDPTKQVDMSEEWVNQPLVKNKKGLIINLDQQIYRLLSPVIRTYAQERDLELSVIDSTCGNSFGMLRQKMVDIGGLCCPPGALDRLPGLRFHTLGITPIGIIVHPDNPIDSITVEEARKIFTGEISRWSELKTPDGSPGPDADIKPVGRLHCKTRPGHWRLLLDNENLFSEKLHEVRNIPDMVSQVAAGPYAVGHVSAWLAKDHYKDIGSTKSLKIDGYPPEDLDALLNGKYPFYKTFSITTWEVSHIENPDAGKLAQFILEKVESLDKSEIIIPSSRLRKGGWRFSGSELVGEPR